MDHHAAEAITGTVVIMGHGGHGAASWVLDFVSVSAHRLYKVRAAVEHAAWQRNNCFGRFCGSRRVCSAGSGVFCMQCGLF